MHRDTRTCLSPASFATPKQFTDSANGPTGVKRRPQSNVEDESVAEPASPGQQPHPEAATERSPPSSAEKQTEAPLQGMQPSVSQDSLTQEEEEDSDAAKLAGDLQKVRI